MQLRTALAVGIAGILALTTGVAVPTAAQEDPRAEAGLDQEVTQGVSVLLDASESWSPAGELVDYDWSIESPGGASVSPSCDASSCRFARFPADETGVYEVTVSVEDEAGGTASDTVYVESVAGGPFGVNLTPPEDPQVGEEAELTAVVSAGNATLDRLEWERTGRNVGEQSIHVGGTYTRSETIVSGGFYRVRAFATDGRNVSDVWVAPVDQNATWTGEDDEEYPRIEGPELVTGEPDVADESSTWEFENVEFEVESGPLEFDDQAMWTALGPTFGSNYHTRGVTNQLDLGPGVNHLFAEVDYEVAQEDMVHAEPMEGDERPERLINGNLEATAHHTVVVDPEPEIELLVLETGERDIRITYNIRDPYNPPSTIEATFDGSDRIRIPYEPDESSRFTEEEIDVPDGVAGFVNVTVTFEDPNDQRAFATERVFIQAPPPDEDIDAPVPEEVPPPYRDDYIHLS